MVNRDEIQQFVDGIAEAFNPQRVILFGSHARGDATPDSDVDLLVIMPTKKRTVQQALEIRQRVNHPFPLDLLVRTPRDVCERLAMRDCFLQTILEEGKTLYESHRR